MGTRLFIHQDNALSHELTVTMAKLEELGFELILHPPYSSDMASCALFVFPNLRNLTLWEKVLIK